MFVIVQAWNNNLDKEKELIRKGEDSLKQQQNGSIVKSESTTQPLSSHNDDTDRRGSSVSVAAKKQALVEDRYTFNQKQFYIRSQLKNTELI